MAPCAKGSPSSFRTHSSTIHFWVSGLYLNNKQNVLSLCEEGNTPVPAAGLCLDGVEVEALPGVAPVLHQLHRPQPPPLAWRENLNSKHLPFSFFLHLSLPFDFSSSSCPRPTWRQRRTCRWLSGRTPHHLPLNIDRQMIKLAGPLVHVVNKCKMFSRTSPYSDQLY